MVRQPKQVLILTQPTDLHALAVGEALRRKGADAVLWFTTDFPARGEETVALDGGGLTIRLDGPELQVPRLAADTVWRRRPGHLLEDDVFHPADREFANLQALIFRQGLLDTMLPDAFWVNPQAAAKRAQHKMVQQAAAAALGFPVPDTLYTNSPRAIRDFLRRQGGRIVYKVFHGSTWRHEEKTWTPFTSLVTEADLVGDELLRGVPGIYQAVVPKAHELRVTVMGRCVMGAKLLSQETEHGRLDWRKSYGELRMEPTAIAPGVREFCFRLMRELGIVFGCFDFVVTPAGETVFIEVNEMGQFLFVEAYTGLPLLDAFCDFLLAGSPEFTRSPAAPAALRYSDLEAVATGLYDAAPARHAVPPEPYWLE